MITQRRLAMTLALLMVGLPALADQAKPRGGGGGSSGGSGGSGGGNAGGGGASSRHPGGSASSSSSGGSHSGSSSSGATSRQPGPESRHPRPGTGHGNRYGYYYPGSYYYSPYYYGYYPYGYYPYGYYGYGYGYPFAFSYYGSYGNGGQSSYRESSSIRLLVDPSETRVYVDGYYSGVVDDFDGIFQRLHVSPGRHEITLKLDGYRTHRLRLYAPPDHTLKIHHDMVKGSGEDVEEMPGEPGAYEERRPSDEGYRQGEPPAGPAADQGMLRLSVRPDDASVYVDGEFRGTARQVRSMPLPPGRHRVEVVRPGYRTFDHDVEIRPGRPAEVEVEMERPY